MELNEQGTSENTIFSPNLNESNLEAQDLLRADHAVIPSTSNEGNCDRVFITSNYTQEEAQPEAHSEQRQLKSRLTTLEGKMDGIMELLRKTLPEKDSNCQDQGGFEQSEVPAGNTSLKQTMSTTTTKERKLDHQVCTNKNG